MEPTFKKPRPPPITTSLYDFFPCFNFPSKGGYREVREGMLLEIQRVVRMFFRNPKNRDFHGDPERQNKVRRALYLLWLEMPQQNMHGHTPSGAASGCLTPAQVKQVRSRGYAMKLDPKKWPKTGKAMSNWIKRTDNLKLPVDWWPEWGHWYLDGYLPTLVFNAAIRWAVLDQAWRVVLKGERPHNKTRTGLVEFEMRMEDVQKTDDTLLYRYGLDWVWKARKMAAENGQRNIPAIPRIEVLRFPSLVHSGAVDTLLPKRTTFKISLNRRLHNNPFAFYDAPIVMTAMDRTEPFSLNVLSLSTMKRIPKSNGLMKLPAVSQENKARIVFLVANPKQAYGTMDAARIDAEAEAKQQQ